MAKTKSRSVYVCQNCRAQRTRWEGRCTDCGEWNSFVEEQAAPAEAPLSGRQRGWSPAQHQNEALGVPTVLTLDQNLEAVEFIRFATGFSELDRVLGGGLVEGSFLLLGGDPGIGKSTLVLQMAGGLARINPSFSVLYISGEESVNQSGLRAQRLGVRSSRVRMASESNLRQIMELAKSYKPSLLVVDSIQTVFLPEVQAAPGSVSQVRECAAQLMGLAKGSGICVLLVGHVTKEGQIAGPKVLEHMVDTVLSFEGDLNHHYRLLRALKNRFGATHELGVFQMEGSGLSEVANPSELFLEERGQRLFGSSVTASIEGTRPLLCEVQALTNPTTLPQPRRTSIGFDINRVNLLTAVLSRHLGLRLSQADVFVNVVGGLRLIEPAADLAVAAALISTEAEIEIGARTCFFGEIGLTGEVRAVPFADLRIREAEKLGFDTFVIPKSNKKHLDDLPPKIKAKIVWISEVYDLKKWFKALPQRPREGEGRSRTRSTPPPPTPSRAQIDATQGIDHELNLPVIE